MADQQDASVTNEQADATSRKFGVVLLCVGLGIAYLLWPAGAADVALGAVTLGMLLRAIASIGTAIASFVIAAMFWM